MKYKEKESKGLKKKIGILTFHSQLNYGGILQSLALLTVLKKFGHDICVIDRWIYPNNSALKEFLAPPIKLKKLLTLIVCWLLGSNQLGRGIRIIKTVRFINHYLNLTSYHFDNWQEIDEKDVDLDCIVVGSDQVWNGTYGFPENYFLVGAPKDIRAIGYAISFGMQKIPEEIKLHYIQGGKRFAKVSVREKTGIDLADKMGIYATWVADPTLLLQMNEWHDLLHIKKKCHSQQTLICYFMLEDITDFVSELNAFSSNSEYQIKVFYNSRWANYKRMPIRLSECLKRLRLPGSGCLKIMDSASPKDFVEAIANADYVISDSFHALMFSTIFQKNVFILSPHEVTRTEMFSRITDFIGEFSSLEVICENLQSALDKINKKIRISYDLGKLQRFCNLSSNWLRAAIEDQNNLHPD